MTYSGKGFRPPRYKAQPNSKTTLDGMGESRRQQLSASFQFRADMTTGDLI